jgi:hypothetical protein
VALNRLILTAETQKDGLQKDGLSFIRFRGESCRRKESSLLGGDPCRGSLSERAPSNTILFIPLSGNYCNPDFDWAAAGGEPIIRFCPKCLRDTIIGHGRRRKQAHDESHDWIETRRGLCKRCEETFTFLPVFSLPYTQYSLLARSQALRRYFLEQGSWEGAVPPLKDPDRVPDPSTLRRWFHSLDSSRPAFSFLRPALELVGQWLTRGERLECGFLRLSWQTVFPFLQVFWPLRL